MGTDAQVLADEIAKQTPLAKDIVARMRAEVRAVGLNDIADGLMGVDSVHYRLEQDSFSGQCSLAGDWLDVMGWKKGLLLFHPDGSFMAEQDVAQEHPSRKGWFIEGVHVWGKNGDIKAELNLLQLPG
jgi:hypothetical protein